MRPGKHTVAPLLGAGPDKFIEGRITHPFPQVIDYLLSKLVNRLLMYDFAAVFVPLITDPTTTAKSSHAARIRQQIFPFIYK